MKQALKASPLPVAAPLIPLPWQGPEPPLALLACDGSERAAPQLLLLDRTAPGRHPALAALDPLLSDPERQRMAAFRLPEDRERFLLGRGCLRLLLGRLLACDPAALPLLAGPHGKPALAQGGGPHFNLSHSGDLILLALHPDRPVGVDVELRRPGLDWRPIARRILPAMDCAALEALPPAEQAAAFLRRWCRLEAQLKASGEGLARLRRLREACGAAKPAPELWDVAVPEGYGAAVALAGGG